MDFIDNLFAIGTGLLRVGRARGNRARTKGDSTHLPLTQMSMGEDAVPHFQII